MRFVRRLAHVLIVVVALVISAASAAMIVSQTAWFKNWLRGYIMRVANQYLNGTLSIDRLGGNLFFGVEMENISIAMDGRRIVAVKDLGLKYNVFELATHGLSVDEVRIDHPVIDLKRDGDTWQLSRLVKNQQTEADRSGSGRPIAIDALEVADGTVFIDTPVATSGIDVPKKFEHLDASLSFRYEPVRYAIAITNISFHGDDPSIALNALSGNIAVHDDAVHLEKLTLRMSETSVAVDGVVRHYQTKPDFNLQITSDRLSIPEVARVVPALAGVMLEPAFEVSLAGTLDGLHIRMNVRSSAGLATGDIVAGLLAPGQSVKGDLAVRRLDLAPILNDPKRKSDITANARVDLHAKTFGNLNSLHGGVSVDLPRIVAAGYAVGPIKANAQIQGRSLALTARAHAYGANATANGHLTVPAIEGQPAVAQPILFDVSGRLSDVDLRALPEGLNLPPAETHVSADCHVAGAVTGQTGSPWVTGDVSFLPSTVAGAEIAGGSRARFALKGGDVRYQADATATNLDLQRVGRAFNVPALATPRYQSHINARLSASGSGRTSAEMTVDATGALTDTTVMGGRIPRLDFSANVARGNAHVIAFGSFSGFDPAAASGNERVRGTVAGDVNLDATLSNVANGVTTDSIAATAQLDLAPSTVGGLEITSANLDADYGGGSADVRWLDIVGRDLNVVGSGTIALNEEGQSNFALNADSPNLGTIGTLVNQPLTGIAKIDATITGNKGRLEAKGTVVGDGVKYGENGALTASTDFTVTIPDSDPAEATVSTDTHATFITLGGQTINELQAKADYHQPNVEFDLNARQPQRSLTVGGTAVLHPDSQDVHLRSLGLQSQGVSWQLAPGAQPAIQYGGGEVAVNDLRLVNEDQTITVEGTFGKPADALHVSVKNIDVGTVDALLMRPPQLSGRFDATSTVGGTREAPSVDAQFAIAQGGFRQFHYDALTGTIKWDGAGVTLDTRLQQNPTTWLEAKGHAPAALFNGTAASSTEPVDLHMDSSSIDLGLIQGFTAALTNVRGTLEAHVDVTGTAAAPSPAGTITIENGAFKVEPTGVAYGSLTGRIDLQPDRVHVDQIKLVDNQRKPLTISGDLAVNERQLGGVSIKVSTDDFKIIDNKMGSLRIKSDVAFTGDLGAPRVEGSLGVTTGRLELDPILAQTGTSAYATEQAEYAAPNAGAPDQTPSSSAFDALQMDLHLTVPDDLVVRASDLRAPGAPVSLGALNVTLGGDLWIDKSPWDQIRLAGPVKTIRGIYEFQGRRFTILRDGTIRFEGLDDIDPTLDIRTERVIQAVTANVNVRGTLKRPDIVLSSNPPLEQADILSLIVFNQPLNQVGVGQQVSIAQRAEQMAAGTATSALTKSVGNSLGLDLFEINLAPEQGGGPNVTVGQQVGQNLYLKVEQGIGDASQTNVILEYELTSWLRFRTNVLQGTAAQQAVFQRAQGSGADLLFFFSY